MVGIKYLHAVSALSYTRRRDPLTGERAVLRLFVLGARPRLGDPLEAVVTKVTDGDTIEAGGQRVRLQGIDALERDQPHGLQATASLQSLILNRRVRLDVQSTDQYVRLIAVVYRGERNVNRWLVRQGHA